MKGRLRFILWGIGLLLATAMTVLFAYGSLVHGALIRQLGTTSGTLVVPYWPFYYLCAFAFSLYAIIMGIDTIKTFLAISNEKYAEEIASHWVL